MVYSICCLPLESENEVARLCLTLCNPMDCSPQNFPGKSTGVGCHFLLQGIFLTRGSNPGLPHCRQRLYLWATREALLFALNESNHTCDGMILIIYMKSSSSFWKLGSYSISQDNFHINKVAYEQPVQFDSNFEEITNGTTFPPFIYYKEYLDLAE